MVAMSLMAGGAEAKYLNATTGSNANSGLNPQNAWETVAYANANLSADSTIYFAANDTILDAAINPTNTGTTWIGDSTTASNVKVPGVSIQKAFTTVNGFRVVGSLGIAGTGIYAHVRNCTVVSGTTVSRRGARLERNRLGTREASAWLFVNGPTGQTDSLTLKNNTMHLVHVGTDLNWNGQHLLDFQSVSTSATTMKDWSVTGNTCTLTITAGQNWEKTAFLYGLRRATFNNNSWLVRDSCGRNNGRWDRADGSYTNDNQAFVLRDSIKECKFLNETIELRSMDGYGRAHAYLYSSGSQYPCSLNSWKFCTFKSTIGGGSAAFLNEWRAAYRDSFYRNVVVCSTGTTCFRWEGAKDSAFVYRNTFVNLGNGPAFSIGADEAAAGAWASTGRIAASGNIFYTRGGSGVARYEFMPTFASGLLYSDYNVHLAMIPNGSDFSLWKRKHAEFPGRWIKPGDANVDSYELNSAYGHPKFEDSTYTNFDADLAYGSAARGEGPAGVDAGAKDYVAAPPEVVDDLQSFGGTSSTVELGWTAPGESGDQGTATSYDVRYSTSPITDLNFTSATEATGEPSPAAAGTFETMTVTGLTSNTTYYFAMRASNSSRTSYTSNCISERTWPANTVEP